MASRVGVKPHLENLEVVAVPDGGLEQHPDGVGQLIVLRALQETLMLTSLKLS